MQSAGFACVSVRPALGDERVWGRHVYLLPG